MRRTVPFTLAALLAVTACGSDDDDSTDASSPGAAGPPASATPEEVGTFPLTVSDCGREFVIEQRPERVLTQASTAATLMWAAGAADQITTRTSEGDVDLGPAAEDLAKVPVISNDEELPLESIIGEQPDLLITAGRNLYSEPDLQAVGIDSLVNLSFCDGSGSGPADGPVTFEDDVFPDIELYGKIFGTEDVAEAKVAELRERIAAIEESVGDTPLTRMAAIGQPDGTSVNAYGLPSLTHDQIEILGLVDVFGDLPDRFTEVSVEEFIQRDPEVLVVLVGGGGVDGSPDEVLASLQALPGAQDVSAIREGRVIGLGSPYLLGGPLAVDGLETMAEAIAGYE